MSEYCSQCSPFKSEQDWDIDLFEIALNLDNGHSENFICEGCNNRAIYKDEAGKIYLAKQKSNELEFAEVKLEDLMN